MFCPELQDLPDSIVSLSHTIQLTPNELCWLDSVAELLSQSQYTQYGLTINEIKQSVTFDGVSKQSAKHYLNNDIRFKCDENQRFSLNNSNCLSVIQPAQTTVTEQTWLDCVVNLLLQSQYIHSGLTVNDIKQFVSFDGVSNQTAKIILSLDTRLTCDENNRYKVVISITPQTIQGIIFITQIIPLYCLLIYV